MTDFNSSCNYSVLLNQYPIAVDHWQLNTLSNSSTKSEQNLTNIFWEVCLQSKCDGYADAQMNGYTQTLLGPSIILQWTLKLKHLKIQKIPYP